MEIVLSISTGGRIRSDVVHEEEGVTWFKKQTQKHVDLAWELARYLAFMARSGA